jgi:iron complex outermembrane receptor protein
VKDNELSFNLGLDFQTSDRILLFVNLSRGFKGAGFNTEFAPDSLGGTLIFKPEFVNSYEFGMKIKYTGRYRLNLTAFVTDYKDKQETAPGGSAYRVANAKSAQGVGVEAELAAVLGKGFRVDASTGLLRLRYLDFPFSDRNGQPINLSGARLYKAPEFTFQMSPSYTTNIGTSLKMRLQLDYAYVGKTYNDIYNTEALARQSAGVLNGRLEFSTRSSRYSIALWGKNLTDELYFQHAWEFNFGSHVAVNPPRTLGVEFRLNFFK